MKNYILKILIGLLVVFVLDFSFGKVLRHYYFLASNGVFQRTTFSIEETEADILIFGTSRASHHYNVQVIEKETGKSGYNTGKDGNFIFYQTAILKSILKRYKPSQIILDFTGTFEYRQRDYDRLSCLLPYYETHPEIHKIVKLKSPFEEYKLKSKIYPFNSSLTTIAIENFESNKNRKENKEIYKGFVPLVGRYSKNIDSLITKEHYKIDQNKIDVFDEFLNLVTKNEIPIIVIHSPVYYLYDKNYSLEVCKDLCDKYGVNFIDYSKDANFLDNRDYFKDNNHLNKDGAIYLTKKVITEIYKPKAKNIYIK